MANYRGIDGSIMYNAQAVAEVQGMNVRSSLNLLDDSVMGDAWKTFVADQAEWDGTADVQLDYGDTNGQKAIFDKLLIASPATAPVTVQFRVAGTTKIFQGSAFVQNIDITGQVGQIVKARITFKGTGPLTPSWS